MSSPWIIKVGGSLITHRQSEIPSIQKDSVSLLAQDLLWLQKKNHKFILIHGAGSFGHPLAKKWKIHQGLMPETDEKRQSQLLALGQIQVQLYQLSLFLTEGLGAFGLPLFPIQTSSIVTLLKGRIHNCNLSTIHHYLDLGLIPLLSGVPCFDLDLGASILSGDQLGAYLALEMKSPQLVHFTEVGAVYKGDPKKDPHAIIIPRITEENWPEVSQSLSGSSHVDVTGGMLGKIQEAFDLAQKGIPVLISPLGKLKEVLSGKGGTRIEKNGSVNKKNL